jgi:hypothetical protein
MIQALQGQSQMRSPLRLRHRMDLVDDHRFDPGEDLPHARAQHQIQRLRRRDQDVGRGFGHRPPFFLRGVPGPQPDRDLRPDPPQRRPQVALDVVGERFQRRDVDQLHPGPEVFRPRQLVDPPEEAGEGLSRPGRGADQRVLTAGNRLPAARLRRRRPLEGGLEPAPHRRAERRQWVKLRSAFRLGSQPTDLTQIDGSALTAAGALYGWPPASLTYSNQDFFGVKPAPKRPEPSQKLQAAP